MARAEFYQYLFDRDVLFKLPSEDLTHGLSDDPAAEDSVEENAVVPTEEVGTNQEVSSPFQRLKTRLLILVNTYGKGIKKEEREFLAKVLKAVGYDLERVDLIELDQIDSTDASGVLANRLADYILLFGIKPEGVSLDVSLDLYQPKQENGVWLLMSNSLLRIEMEESKRRDLWTALKKMFLR